MILALSGNPNCGKTALFNALTGGRQKVGNYPGVTVEKKSGTVQVSAEAGGTVTVLDLPGTYSLDAKTPDEEITRDVLLGRLAGEEKVDGILAVVDATNLERNLGLILELKELGRPMVLALNMIDLAKSLGQVLNEKALSDALGIPVIATIAVKKTGTDDLIRRAVEVVKNQQGSQPQAEWSRSTPDQVRARFARVDQILKSAVTRRGNRSVLTEKIDRVLLHPFWGSLALVLVLVLLFQAIFSWAKVPTDLIDSGVTAFGKWTGSLMSEGPLKSLIVDGVIAGVGAVVVFIPQILLLFFFILLLEDSGYMARAAFIMDRIMGKVGLHGRAFIPLLSSFACAIPGIMATRTIENRRDRLTTILVAPMMTCSARLPVYSLLIAAFIPNTEVFGPLKLQGLVMFGLYAFGVVMALLIALLFKSTILKGKTPPLLLELPSYKRPSLLSLMIGLKDRAILFLKNAGTVIVAISIVLWFLSSYPKAPDDASKDVPEIHYSYAGKMGHAIEPLIQPIGFDWRIGISLIPAFAAREVMVSALGTVYAVEGEEDAQTTALTERLSHEWSIATGLSLLVWFALAFQCLSTFAVIRRETNSWRWPVFTGVYLTVLSYAGSWITFTVAKSFGLG